MTGCPDREGADPWTTRHVARARNWERVLAVEAVVCLIVVVVVMLVRFAGPHSHSLAWRPAPSSTATSEDLVRDLAEAIDADPVRLEDAMRARGWVLACDECAEAGR